MTRYLRRRPPDREDNLTAAALGLGVGLATGAVAFYLARILLTREVLGRDGPARRAVIRDGDGERRTSARPAPSGSFPSRPTPETGGSGGQ